MYNSTNDLEEFIHKCWIFSSVDQGNLRRYWEISEGWKNSGLVTLDHSNLDTVNDKFFSEFCHAGVIRHPTSVVSRVVPVDAFDAQSFCPPTELCRGESSEAVDRADRVTVQ